MFQTVGIMLLSAAALTAGSVQRWIHVRVESARGGNDSVSINVPIQMATVVLPAVSASQHHSGNINLQASVNGVDLRALLDAVRGSPDNVFVTMERHDKEVSVAKSGQNLLIKIASETHRRPSHRRNGCYY